MLTTYVVEVTSEMKTGMFVFKLMIGAMNHTDHQKTDCPREAARAPGGQGGNDGSQARPHGPDRP